MNIRTVTVIGASGTMGANISGIFASFGNAKVYLVSRDLQKTEQAVRKAIRSVRADCIKDNLIPMEYSMLEACISQSDLVFESIAESFEVKKAVFEQISGSLKEGTLLCTGTSGLSIESLAEYLPLEHRENFYGVHMFNPPYSMTLCELIATRYADPKKTSAFRKYLKDTLLRTVVEVRDEPAFLANRIGFQFINEAMQYAEHYKDNGGIDYMDAILGSFTGRSMAPLATADFVGMDVHKAIVDNVYTNTNDFARETFRLPLFAEALIAEGKLGRKVGKGLYSSEIDADGNKHIKVYDIQAKTYREKIRYVFPFAEQMKTALRSGNYDKAFSVLVSNTSTEAEICLRFLLNYIIYSFAAAEEVGYDLSAADDVMATGFNWCPPFAMLQGLAEVTDVRKLMEERLDRQLVNSTVLEALFRKTMPSKYDYRSYFKAPI